MGLNIAHSQTGTRLVVWILEADTHLSILAAGPYTFENFHHLLDQVNEESERRGKNTVIVDLTGVSGTVSKLDMHELGLHFVRMWNRATRIAFVSQAGGVNEFFESFLWTRGVNVAVVRSLDAAGEWARGRLD